MGRHPKAKKEKLAVGTYRADRDRTVTVLVETQPPEMPLSLEKEGQRFWARAFSLEWVTAADQDLVQIVGEKKDERSLVARAYKQNPGDWRLARTLKDLDRDIQSGLEQLLMTPHARKRAGVRLETKPPSKSPVDLMFERSEGKISEAEYREAISPHLYASSSHSETSKINELPQPGESKVI